MRKEPTKAEKLSAEALSRAFIQDGHDVKFPQRTTQDKPDILIEIDNILIACECTQIPPSYIYQFHQKKHKKTDWNDKEILSITRPNEPHYWLADAINKKSEKVLGYLSRTNAKFAWLLVHSPVEKNQFFIKNRSWIIEALKHGAHINKHLFEQIYLWTPQSGIINLFVSNEINKTKLRVNFSKGYPTLCTNQFSFPFRTTEKESDTPNQYTHEFNTRETMVIEPMDKDYLKHPPALREASYEFKILARSTAAEVNTIVNFNNPNERIILDKAYYKNLESNTDYWAHYLHEYESPKQNST